MCLPPQQLCPPVRNQLLKYIKCTCQEQGCLQTRALSKLFLSPLMKTFLILHIQLLNTRSQVCIWLITGMQLTELVSGSSEHWSKCSQPRKADAHPSVDNSPSTYGNSVDIYICHPAAALHNIMLPASGTLPGENAIRGWRYIISSISLFLFWFSGVGSHTVQTGLNLAMLLRRNSIPEPLTTTSLSAGITVVPHHSWLGRVYTTTQKSVI